MTTSKQRQSTWAVRLLALYPRSWQARYGEEMAELVARQGLGLWSALDLVAGALDAHLHLPTLLKGWSTMERTVRRRVLIVLFAAGLYARAVWGLAETRDAVSFAGSPARLAARLASDLASGMMAIAGCLCLLGACLAAAGALRYMTHKRDYRPLRYLALPPLAVLVALGSGWGLGRLAGHHLHLGLGHGLFLGWNVLVALCGLACVYAAWRLLRAVELQERLWRLLDRLAWVVIGALCTGGVSLVAYLVALAGLDSRLLSARDGLLATPLLATLLAIVAGGIVSAGLAVLASRQKEQAAPTPR